MAYFILLPLFFLAMFFYLRVANHYNIVDHPNERSSHSSVTIRGGGVIFIFAALVALVWHFKLFYTPICGIIIIGIISFLDDIYTLSSWIRMLFHIISVTLIFIFLNVFDLLPLWETFLLYVLAIGIINSFNFMDGINGITGFYSTILLCGLQWINIRQIYFINPDLIWLPILASIVFLFFNFRKKAKCFAGDVGSVTVALWITILLFDLILTTDNYVYILFLSVYGVDSTLTIIHRLLLKQNIFEAHRLHFYQWLVNEQQLPHLWVATGYALLQAIIIMVIINGRLSTVTLFLITLIPLMIIYIVFKPKIRKLNK